MTKLVTNGTFSSALLTDVDKTSIFSGLGIISIQLYFFTGVLENFQYLIYINYFFLVASIIFCIPKVREVISPLVLLYAIVAAIGVINDFIYWPEAGLPVETRTMPIILLLMMAARALSTSGLFAHLVSVNALPFLPLLAVGSHFEDAQFQSLILPENYTGHVLQFAFAVGITALVSLRFDFLYMVSALTSFLNIILSGSRKLLLFLFAGLAVSTLTSLIADRSRSRWLVVSILLAAACVVTLPISIGNLESRFGNYANLGASMRYFIEGEKQTGSDAGSRIDKSTEYRREFIDLSLYAALENWWGYGSGNFPYIVHKYGPPTLPAAGHPHAGVAEALVIAGFPGLVVYAAMLLYLLRIGWKDPVMLIVLVWLLIQAVSESIFLNRYMWPLLVVAEWELTRTNQHQS